MADTEFITRADVERVREEVAALAYDMAGVHPQDGSTSLYLGVYSVVDSVLDHLLNPHSTMWFTPNAIKTVWQDGH